MTMRLPWNRQKDSDERLKEAERELARVKGQWPLVHALADGLRRHTERNHFAEGINGIFRGDEGV